MEESDIWSGRERDGERGRKIDWKRSIYGEGKRDGEREKERERVRERERDWKRSIYGESKR